MITPYTHADHAAYCRQQALLGLVPSRRRVQVMLRRVVYCAQIVEAWTTRDGLDVWTVEADYPQRCRITVPCKQVRVCGQGCLCDGADPVCASAEGAGHGQLAAREPAPSAGVSDGFSSARVTPVFCQAGVVAPPDSLMHEKTPHGVSF